MSEAYPPGADAQIPGLESWMETVRQKLSRIDPAVLTGTPSIGSIFMYMDVNGDVFGVANVSTNTASVRFIARTDRFPTEAEVNAGTPVLTSGLTNVTSGVLATLAPGQEVFLGAKPFDSGSVGGAVQFLQSIPTGVFGQPAYQLTGDVSATLGTASLVLIDPNSLVTKVEFRSKQGAGTWTSYAEDASAPFSADVVLVEGEISQIGLRLTYTDKNGATQEILDQVSFHTGEVATVATPSLVVTNDNADINYVGNVHTASIWRKRRGAAVNTAIQIAAARTANELLPLDKVGIDLTGASGSRASLPDASSLDLTGDFDLRMELALVDLTPTSREFLISKNAAYQLSMSTGGFPTLHVFKAAAETTSVASVAPAWEADLRYWLRVTRASGTGEVLFYTSDHNGSWSQLGSSRSGVTGALDSNANELSLGAETSTAGGQIGKIYSVQMRSAINGTVIMNTLFDQPVGTTSFTERGGGAVVTVNSPASITIGVRILWDAFGKNSAATEGPMTLFSTPFQQSMQWMGNNLLDNIKGGTLQAGIIQDSAALVGIRIDADDTLPGTWVRFIDLGGTGSSAFISHPKIQILHDGTATFSGTLSAGIVVAGTIAAGAINASNLFVTGIIDAAAIGAAQITAGKLAAGSIDATNLFVSGIIDANAIGANQIVAGKLAAGSINANTLFVAGVINANAIGAGEIIAGKLAVGSIDANNLFVAGIINAAAIGVGEIVAGKLAAGSINANNLFVAGVINAAAIGAGQITAVKISVATLSAIAVDVGTITAGKMQDSGGTRGILLSGTVPGGWTRYIDLVGTGTDPFIQHEKVSILHDGTAIFSGDIRNDDLSITKTINQLRTDVLIAMVL